MKKIFILFAAFLCLGLMATVPASASDKAPIYTKPDNLAVGGWDVVSYFSGTPAKGTAEFETTYKGAIWRFFSGDNLASFTADPSSYEPQYGGYCAWGVAKGGLYKGDPKTWKIVDGKLYLNYNKRAQSRWEKDIAGNNVRADANWPELVN